VAVLLALRKERDPARIRAMLDLSATTRPLTYLSLLLLGAGGIGAGLIAGFLGQFWIVASMVLLAVQLGLGTMLIPYFRRLRAALGDSGASLERILGERRPGVIAGLEVLLVAATVWLMVAKPG
jgi:hypothetical protein